MQVQDPASRQSLVADQFSYFFLRLRKERIKKIVGTINSTYPDESTEQKARRLIDVQMPLSFLGGALMHLPRLVPGWGQAFELLGFVGGSAALVRMHLYLILEIGLLYGKDIDDEARVPEMMAVVGATGLATGVSWLSGAINTLLPLAAGGIIASAAVRIIGEEAIRYYSAPAGELVEDL
ncbi:putative membrane protein [Syntrophobacter sp. SbD1]|nr:putative membrane protein [Syntrophobacter sp. SbD1]